MRIFFFLILVTYNIVSAYGQTKKEIAEAAVISFFDGLATFDIEKMKSRCTDDIVILEDGLVWNMDTLVMLVQEKKDLTNFKRINTFDFFKTEIRNKTAYTCYFNQADITTSGKHFTVRWLESAILVKNNGKWRIKVLHSTTIED